MALPNDVQDNHHIQELEQLWQPPGTFKLKVRTSLSSGRPHNLSTEVTKEDNAILYLSSSFY